MDALKNHVQHLWEKVLHGNIYTQLSLEERTTIHTQLEMGLNPTAMAMGLNRSASTLPRELRRNGWGRPTTRRGPGRTTVAGGDRADAAHTRAHACTVTPRIARRLRPGTALWDQHPLPEGRRLAQADWWHTGACACRHASLQVSHEPSTPPSTPCHVANCGRT